jgi:hypothetical protein
MPKSKNLFSSVSKTYLTPLSLSASEDLWASTKVPNKPKAKPTNSTQKSHASKNKWQPTIGSYGPNRRRDEGRGCAYKKVVTFLHWTIPNLTHSTLLYPAESYAQRYKQLTVHTPNCTLASCVRTIPCSLYAKLIHVTAAKLLTFP